MSIKVLLAVFILAFIPSASTAAEYDCENIPCIIYLKGTSCAGKSTLVQSISERWENLEIVDGDTIIHRTYPEAIRERFPSEYEVIRNAIADENIYHAIRLNAILFKPHASEEECRRAELAISVIQDDLNQPENQFWMQAVFERIRKEILDLTEQALHRGKNALLDTWYYKANEVQELFPEIPTIRVMLYCPFEIAYERLLKRNREAAEKANLLEKRYLMHLMESFCRLYQVTNLPIQSIQTINRQDLEEFFEVISQDLEVGDPEKPRPIFSFEELTLSKFQTLQDKFMEPFERLHCENLYLAPIEQQDLIIDNTFGNLQNSLHSLDLVFHFGKQWKDVQALEAMNDETPTTPSPAPRNLRSLPFFPAFSF